MSLHREEAIYTVSLKKLGLYICLLSTVGLMVRTSTPGVGTVFHIGIIPFQIEDATIPFELADFERALTRD